MDNGCNIHALFTVRESLGRQWPNWILILIKGKGIGWGERRRMVLSWIWTASSGVADFLRSMSHLYLSSIYFFAITQINLHQIFMDQKYVCLMMWKLAFSTDISQKKTFIIYIRPLEEWKLKKRINLINFRWLEPFCYKYWIPNKRIENKCRVSFLSARTYQIPDWIFYDFRMFVKVKCNRKTGRFVNKVSCTIMSSAELVSAFYILLPVR